MSQKARWSLLRQIAAGLALTVSGWTASVQAQEPEFPPFEKVTEGFRKIEPKSTDGSSLFNLWVRDKDQQVFVEIPKDFAAKKYFIALTKSSGDPYAGLQGGDFYVYWRQYDKRLALIAPNMEYRSTGEPESRSSVKRLFTDTVLLDVPIVTMVPRGGPLVDADALLVGQASRFFGAEARNTIPGLNSISKAKVFSKNTEIAFEIVGEGGTLQTLHYSLSEVPENNGYKPRKADERVGYFTTAYTDLGIYNDEKVRTRFINRWRLEKRDPALKVSPPVKPIEFYIEHTTPVRYRRWVKQGIEYWNKAFESVGISDAIVVYYQDAQTGKYMDLDPEDVQYNFVRWLNNNVGTAIGPSRVHPLTGEILDADIILTDGWIRHFNFQFNDLMPEIATEGMSAETMAWLADHPNWDPRVRLGSYADRAQILEKIARQSRLPFAGHPLAQGLGSNGAGRVPGQNVRPDQYCLAAHGKQLDMAMARLAFEMVAQEGQQPPKEGEKPAKPKEELLDGMPESFIGPLLADLVAHEVGHTLGLRHNFRASSVYSLAEINSEDMKGKKPLAGSVMDYIPVNFNQGGGAVQGDWTMIDIGPYDMWAIQYGYDPDDNKLPEILKRVSEPELTYATDEDTSGPDPLARRYDYSKNPLEYAENQMRLVKLYRDRLLEKFVKPGDSWAKARRGYELTLSEQSKAINMMSSWIGGTFVNRDKKGDPGDRSPVTVVPAEMQRKALDFVMQQSFVDDSFGLKPEVIQKMTIDRWMDGGFRADGEPAWPIHDRILSIQASALTSIMNPTTLRRVYDNEVRTPADQDALTLPEMLDKVTANIWGELDAKPEGEASNRKPRISSLRRNLQREHVERLIDLTIPAATPTSASKVICNLSLMQLRKLNEKIGAAVANPQGVDTYTMAHLTETQQRITKALDASYIYNVAAPGIGGGRGPIIIGNEEAPAQPFVNELP